MASVLIDTNVLIYAIDGRKRVAQDRAIEVLRMLQLANAGCLSVQCLSEFAATATRRLDPPLTWDETYRRVQELIAGYELFGVTPQIVLTAIHGARDYKLAYYDAQLWATAVLNQVPVIFSEDFASGSTLDGVRVVNPFADKFVLSDWA